MVQYINNKKYKTLLYQLAKGLALILLLLFFINNTLLVYLLPFMLGFASSANIGVIALLCTILIEDVFLLANPLRTVLGFVFGFSIEAQVTSFAMSFGACLICAWVGRKTRARSV